MRNYLTIILGWAVLLGPGLFQHVSAQESVIPKEVVIDSVTVFFKPSQSALDPSFSGNAVALENFFSRVQSALEGKTSRMSSVIVRPGASPEGPSALNERLARERQASLLKYLGSRLDIPEGIEVSTVQMVDWPLFRSLVSEDKAMPQELKAKTLEVLDHQPAKGSFKERVGEEAWAYVHDHFFPDLRSATTVLVWDVDKPVVKVDPEPDYEPAPKPEPVVEPEPVLPIPVQPVYEEPEDIEVAPCRTRDFVVKLNLLALPALVLNGGVEAQVADHFSLALTAYYAGWDWMQNTIKFRTLTFQPEARFWFNPDLHGFFLGVHGTLGWYNVAWGGDYRYQDNRPSIGAGINAGYKFRIGEGNSPWGLETGLGLGVLPLHYDRFYNVPNGRLASSGNRVLFGPDQFFVSLTYRFGQTKHSVK